MNTIPTVMTGYKLFVVWEKTSTISMSFLARFFDCSDFSFDVSKVDQWCGIASWPEQLWSPRCPLYVSLYHALFETTVLLLFKQKGLKALFNTETWLVFQYKDFEINRYQDFVYCWLKNNHTNIAICFIYNLFFFYIKVLIMYIFVEIYLTIILGMGPKRVGCFVSCRLC